MIPAPEEFKRVRVDAEQALEQIKADKVKHDGAVNWGDLDIRGIRWAIEETGNAGWQVFIEECQEGSLNSPMYEFMVEKNVEILCEW